MALPRRTTRRLTLAIGASALVLTIAFWLLILDEMTRGMMLAVVIVWGSPVFLTVALCAWLARATLSDFRCQKVRKR